MFPGLWTHGKEQAYSNTLAAVKESVERVGLQYIDLMLLHAPGESDGRSEAWRALEDAQAQVTRVTRDWELTRERWVWPV